MSLSILRFASSELARDWTGAPARHRGGRLPLPTGVASMTETEEPALRAVNAFVDVITELAPSKWIDVGRAVLACPQNLGVHSGAWAALGDAIAAGQLGVAAWCARDGVETAAQYVRRAATQRMSRSDRLAFYAAQGAAEETALALLARGHLSFEHFDVLSAPYRAAAQRAASSV